LTYAPRDNKLQHVTPDTALDSSVDPQMPQPQSTAGMTTKVVKGSIWTLFGQVAPFAVSFIATPFVIRFLGAESYGVLLLIGLIPTYFLFADFGMGIASTKFASEAYGEGDRTKESETVWTAAFVAFATSLTVAVPLVLFSSRIIGWLNVPERLREVASTGLKISSAAFLVGILALILNSPMLARLRMDLNASTQALSKILLSAGTPLVLYLGGGLVGAVAWSFVVAVIGLATVFILSRSLLPELIRPTFNRDLLGPMLKFGGSWFIAAIAAILLINLEKLFLTRMVSVQALAFYSVAFTFANMAMLFSSAMTQSLIPAFSQLQAPEKRAQYQSLFARSIRLNLMWLLPALAGMFVVARVFFTLWAGEDFGRESTLPFYILLAGLLLNIVAHVPHAAITAAGRTDLFARLYWIELVIYAIAAYFLISNFGIVGAAAAWTLRAMLDAFIIVYLAWKHADVRFGERADLRNLAIAVLALIPPVILAAYNSFSLVLIALLPIGLTIYSLLIWRTVVAADEKKWVVERYQKLIARS
jgi:O-antigen/teichoic acid export membrane protein